jgi:hypothetical protein
LPSGDMMQAGAKEASRVTAENLGWQQLANTVSWSHEASAACYLSRLVKPVVLHQNNRINQKAECHIQQTGILIQEEGRDSSSRLAVGSSGGPIIMGEREVTNFLWEHIQTV